MDVVIGRHATDRQGGLVVSNEMCQELFHGRLAATRDDAARVASFLRKENCRGRFCVYKLPQKLTPNYGCNHCCVMCYSERDERNTSTTNEMSSVLYTVNNVQV
ncbi:hypothetical protein B5X24_HaOG205297 [Helicoverpa armigera]|uniref:Uncharacterized protein n=1 Tax=Helicoverpa armigera TaxID=29058 RepID=A0A2W1BTK0_HELAM|nr:hypothetical protein B5X24_HaOG205297 [Helicoverpa armigera]